MGVMKTSGEGIFKKKGFLKGYFLGVFCFTIQ